VQRFLKEHVRSVGELEVLLLLHRDPERWWTAEAVNEELRASLQAAKDGLAHLHSVGLAERGGRDAQNFRLEGACADGDSVVGQLAELFKHNLSSVIEAIYAPKHDTLREFADAFRLTSKKDRDNG
jgi:hypothetical protein